MYPKTLTLPALAMMALFGLAGCGGGSGGGTANPPGNGPVTAPPPPPPPPPPEIQAFNADKAEYFVGERANLTVRFSGGTGRIEPDIGAVTSGATVRTPVLEGTRQLRLVVESTAGTVTRSLSLPVRYRDQYRSLELPFSSRGHSATLVDDGTVLLIGGSRGERTLSSTINRYEPAFGTFQRIGSLATGREGHTAVLLLDGRILVSGGESSLPTLTAEVVDPRTGVASPTGAPRFQRTMHASVRLADGRVLVVGGQTAGEGAPLGISRSAEIWDPRTGQFRLLGATLATPRAGHTATLMPDGRVLIVGGFSTAGGYNFVEVFDPATESFAVVASAENRERGLHAAVQRPDGSVLILGGESSTAEPLSGVFHFRTDLTSERVADLLYARTLTSAVGTRDGEVLLFGGEIWPGNLITGTAEGYTALRGGFPIAGLPQPRIGHTATRLNDGRVLIAGGETLGGQLVPAALVYE
jgi:hypothetical protein